MAVVDLMVVMVVVVVVMATTTAIEAKQTPNNYFR